MKKKYVLIGLLLVMAVAIFFRLWQITTIPPGFYPDEAMNGNNANEAWTTGNFKVFYPENNGREGLWINMMAPFLAIFGNEPWVPRVMSAIIGILTVLGLYFLTKELFKSGRVALLASFFLATSFWHINFSRIGFRAILAPFFLVWSFYFLWKVLRQAQAMKIVGVGAQNFREAKILGISNFHGLRLEFFAVIAGILFGLGFYTYIAYRAAPLLLIIPFILMWRKKQKKLIFIFLVSAFIVALPLGIYFLKNPQDFFGRTSQISIFAGQSPLYDLGLNVLKTIGMFFWAGDYNWRHNLPGSPELWWPVAILFLIGIIISLRDCCRKKNQAMRGELCFLIIWLVIMLIPVVVSNEAIPHALRSIIVVPVAMIFAALGLEWIVMKVSNLIQKKMEQRRISAHLKHELIFLLFAFLFAVATNTFNQYFLRWAGNPRVADAFNENYVELGRYLNMLPKNIPKYVIINADGVDIRDVPMPSQTTMFITKTFLPEWQKEKNIFYVPIKNLDSFIGEMNQKKHLYITSLEIDSSLREKLKAKVPGLKMSAILRIISLHR